MFVLGLGEGEAALNATCHLQIVPAPIFLPFTIPGSGAGAGSLSLPIQPPMAMVSAEARIQVLIADPGGAGGLASTNPIRIRMAN